MAKKGFKNFAILLITVFLMTFLQPSFANSLPSYWEGYPSYEVLSVDENSPIEVKSEHLLFDISEFKEYRYTITGRVTAAYEMFNPTDEDLTVQMAFPFITRLDAFSKDDISITADNENIPFEIYIGEPVEGYSRTETEQENFLDISRITKAINTAPFQGRIFSETDKGVLYTFEVVPENEEEIRFSVAFNDIDARTKIAADGFNSFEGGQDYIKVSGWCRGKTVFNIFVLGDKTDFKVEGYTDVSDKERTDSFSYNVTEKIITVKSFIDDIPEEPGTYYSDIIDQVIQGIGKSQLCKMYMSAMDEILSHSPFVSYGDLKGEIFTNRLIILVYGVQFPANSGRTVSVRYNATGTMDKLNTKEPLYSFTYLLTPAKYWASFSNLNIEVLTPARAPYMVQSSIEFENAGTRHYTASVETLPENELTFTIYSENKQIKKSNVPGNSGRTTFKPLPEWPGRIKAIAFLLILAVLVAVIIIISRIRRD
ncbi:MAG: hypothetical protein GXZ01_11640 [Clostridiaceae bacterium]|nr:hypothetical protein [Clostridiaceae bacterium]